MASESDSASTPTPAAATENGSLDVVEATTTADWVREGYETIVRVTVQNTDGSTTTGTLNVTLDGEPVTAHDVTVDGGDTVTVDLPAVFDRAADGTVAVDDVRAGVLTVGAASGETQTPSMPDEQTGFSGGAAVVALLAVALILRLFAGRDRR